MNIRGMHFLSTSFGVLVGTSANVYQVTAPVPVTLDLPDGATTK